MKHIRTLAALLGALVLAALGNGPAAAYSNTLTMSGATYDTSGQKIGSAALAGGYGTAASNIITSVPFTMEAWVKRAATSAIVVAMGSQNTAWIGCDASSNAQTIVGSSTGPVSLDSTTPLCDGTWHHVAVVAGTSATTLYVDGVSVKTGSAVTNISYSDKLAVAAYGTSTSNRWGGEVDEAVIWLTAKYSGNFTPQTTPYSGSEGMIALYHLDSSGADSSTLPGVAYAVNNPMCKFSPFNQYGDAISSGMVARRGGSLYRKTWNVGAWMYCQWTAAASPTAYVLIPQSGTTQYSYFLNGVLSDLVTPSGGTITLAPTANSVNTLWLFVAANETAAVWNGGANQTQITGLQLDNASTPGNVTYGKPALFTGDSIECGWKSNGGSSDFITSHAFPVMLALSGQGYDVGMECSSGSGWLNKGNPGAADVPALYYVTGSTNGKDGTYSAANSRFGLVDQGISMLDSAGHLSGWGLTGQEPAIIETVYGTNDLGNQQPLLNLQASEYQWLVATRAAAPGAAIVLPVEWPLEYPVAYANTTTYPIRPASYLAALSAGISAYRSAVPSDNKLTVEDDGVAFAAMLYSNLYYVYSDYLHPLATGNGLIAASEISAIRAAANQTSTVVFRPQFFH